jgi:hypothetical protein
MADAVTNIVGHSFERAALYLANKLRNGHFTAKTIN